MPWSLLLPVLAAIVVGCGGDVEPPARTPTPLDATTTGTIRGAVRFTGTPPASKALRLNAECAALHDGPVSAGDVRVTDGGVANAFVWIKEGLGDRVFAIPTDPVVLDQRGCIYTPRVAGAQVGQEIRFVNSDPFLHNVHGSPEAQRGWNFGMGIQGSTRSIRLTAAEVPVSIRCDVHPWMQAWLGVVDHPYFAVTGADGTFTLANVPPGDYVVGAWHERFGTLSISIHLDARGTGEAVLTFAPAEN